MYWERDLILLNSYKPDSQEERVKQNAMVNSCKQNWMGKNLQHLSSDALLLAKSPLGSVQVDAFSTMCTARSLPLTGHWISAFSHQIGFTTKHTFLFCRVKSVFFHVSFVFRIKLVIIIYYMYMYRQWSWTPSVGIVNCNQEAAPDGCSREALSPDGLLFFPGPEVQVWGPATRQDSHVRLQPSFTVEQHCWSQKTTIVLPSN